MQIIRTLILVMLTLTFIKNGQAQNIPNGGFENWSLFLGVNNPDGWQTTAQQPCDSVYPKQVNDNIEGNSAILFQTRYVFGAGVIGAFASNTFPISNKPTYFNGYYKSLRTGFGGAEIKVTFRNNGIIIGNASLSISSNVNNYSNFSIPITYNSTLIPDEAVIFITSDTITNMVLGNRLWVDDLSFSSFPLSVLNNIDKLNYLQIYPNPVTSDLTVELENKDTTEIRIFNISGQLVLNKEIILGKNIINTALLNRGFYILECTNDQEIRTIKFIKE